MYSSSVVFPAPRKPLRRVTGRRDASVAEGEGEDGGTAMGISEGCAKGSRFEEEGGSGIDLRKT